MTLYAGRGLLFGHVVLVVVLLSVGGDGEGPSQSGGRLERDL